MTVSPSHVYELSEKVSLSGKIYMISPITPAAISVNYKLQKKFKSTVHKIKRLHIKQVTCSNFLPIFFFQSFRFNIRFCDTLQF